MREIVLRHHRRYGSPRVREELRRVCGKRVSRKKAARLMREYGLNAHRRGKYIPATRPNHGLPVRENILDRRFCAGKPGEKRVSDITYLRTVGGWVYLTVVFDLYDRKVIGWALGGDMESGHTAVPVLETARRKPRRLTRPAISFRPRRAVLLKSVL
jgi:transposase InsO family protein